jgi:hypothetical protein
MISLSWLCPKLETNDATINTYELRIRTPDLIDAQEED